MSEPKIGRVVPAPGVPSQSERRLRGVTFAVNSPALARIRELEAALAVEKVRAEAAEAQLGRIAGFVNGYHNDGTTLTAAETLRAVADVLGDPFAGSSPASAQPQEP